MSKDFIHNNILQGVADAIRYCDDTTAGIAPVDYAERIRALDKLIPQPDALNFYMPNGGTISLNKTGSPTVVELEYWLNDNGRWIIWEEDANGNRSLTLSAGQKVFIRNTSTTSTTFSLSQNSFYSFDFSAITYAYGNTNYLLNKIADNATLSDFCFYRLFDSQTNLKTAPELPSVQLAPNCYRQMFSGSGITKSPYLPAGRVSTYAMLIMFSGCADIIEIRTAMTDISALNCIYAWVRDISAQGDFYCPAELTIPT